MIKRLINRFKLWLYNNYYKWDGNPHKEYLRSINIILIIRARKKASALGIPLDNYNKDIFPDEAFRDPGLRREIVKVLKRLGPNCEAFIKSLSPRY